MSSRCFKKKDKPKVLMIISVEYGYADMSCVKKSGIYTPNLDILAKDSVRFIQSYATSLICSPSPISLITGTWNRWVWREIYLVWGWYMCFTNYTQASVVPEWWNLKSNYHITGDCTDNIWRIVSKKLKSIRRNKLS